MRIGIHEISSTVRMGFDGKVLYISRLVALIPGFHGEWQEVATFTDEQAWNASEFPAMIQNEYHKDMIDWFWTDLSILSLM